AAAHLARVFGAVPPEDRELITTSEAAVIRFSADRYEILLRRPDAEATRQLLEAGTQSMAPMHWERLDIRAGVPTVVKETQEAFVPQMLNLDLIGGLSFSKGCYPGQEIVARMHFLGRLKQRTYLARLPA